jgi:hypothetical protein
MSNSSLVLNLGSGKDWREDCINADIQRRIKSDWCLDIQDVHWGSLLVTRKGDFRVKREMFDVGEAERAQINIAPTVKF